MFLSKITSFLTQKRYFAFTCSLSFYVTLAHAQNLKQPDLLQQRKIMAQRYIDELHARPLIAKCASHSQFIAKSTPTFQDVRFTANDFAKSTIKPWSGPFSNKKQRINVDTIVTVYGAGIRTHHRTTQHLRFRCGYSDGQLLAFDWNDPVPPYKPHYEPGERRPRHAKQTSTKKHIVKKRTSNTLQKKSM